MVDKPLDIIKDFATGNPPVNVEALARALGLRVNKVAQLPEGISGHLRKNEDGIYEIAASGDEHYFRQRFTLAHEIGHFILHRDLVDRRGGVDDDRKYRSTSRGDLYNSHIALIHEKQANSFAANLLMPEGMLRGIIDSQDTSGITNRLTDLYQRFQVSPSAMWWRLKSLRIDKKVRNDTGKNF